MNYSKGSSVAATIGILALVIAVGVGAYFIGKGGKNPESKSQTNVTNNYSTPAQSNQQTPSSQASVDSFSVVKPKLYVYGKNLTKVEVVGLPTGTGITQTRVVGNATLQSTATNGTQTWALDMTGKDLLLTSLAANGYANGSLVGTLQLPYTGATAIYEAFN